MIGTANRFNFGKYNGRLVIDVARFDPQYIWWVENNMGYRFTDKVKHEARASANRALRGFPNTSTNRSMFL